MDTTVEIPGGTATFRGHGDLSKREERALFKLWGKLGPVAQAIAAAAEAAKDDGADEQSLAAIADSLPAITEEQYDTLFQIEDLTITTFLTSWTLDQPLPTLESVSELPRDLYDALSAKVQAVSGDVFSLDPDPEPTAPFGA